ncbi:DUF3526 domain-containing protein [Flammeovirgaceae bacterium SG7u.111]|nr:DUF3526 domain-containing protein [Flammeovirgaceae bacterium SG7u.132]WPO38349.1 DUF3526 domain-containing protein [Flammeovirgaceae bacterium SG7u.111]
MRKEILFLIAKQFWASAFKSKAIYFLLGLMVLLLLYAAYGGIQYHDQNHFRENHQQMARESWEANPDKHPHRMAHFGTFAFRMKHPLSTFDFGIESFTGNVVFLEAHKQNMVNFSEASFSTSLIRFGELSMAMVLQTILPLIIFFIGYTAVVADRENGTLKILLIQGATWKEILYGKAIGLFSISSLFYLPFALIMVLILITDGHSTSDDWIRLFIVLLTYLLYLAILAMLTMIVSVSSQSSKNALVKLLGLWLLFVVVLPRASQAVGSYFHPTPTKLEFKGAIEEEVIQFGDSHDPNDPYFTAIRDSVLKVHNVQSIDSLPFNYGGFQMSVGEKISAEIYKSHHGELLNQYRKQNQWTKLLALVNPYLGVKNLSMTLCGTDLESYVGFQHQAEDYRYNLAQTMNELQVKYIKANVSSSEGAVNVVDSKEWESFPNFSYEYPTVGPALQNELIAIVSIACWMLFSVGMMNYWSNKASAL